MLIDMLRREPIQGEVIDEGTKVLPIAADSTSPPGSPIDDIRVPSQVPIIKAEDENKLQYSNGEKWEPSKLNSRHREMMRRILEGATYLEIAEEMGLSTQSIMLVCNSAIFKEELSKLEGEKDYEVIRRAEELSNEALDKLKILMRRARSENLQASCAERVLGIAGYSKIEKKQLQIVKGEDVIRELNRRRREASTISVNGDSGETPRSLES